MLKFGRGSLRLPALVVVVIGRVLVPVYVNESSRTHGGPGAGVPPAGLQTGGGSSRAMVGTDPVLRLFPGSVSVSTASEADLARLDAGSARRGSIHPRPRRAFSEEQQLQALCEWLHLEHHLSLIGVVTFSDEYAARHNIYSFQRALDDVWVGLRDVEVKGKRGFPWKFVLAAEHHRTARTVPHVHLALECASYNHELVCTDLWRYFYNTRGRSRFEPMRDVSAATLYGLKDTVKSSKVDDSAVALRLWHPKRRSGSSGLRSSGGGGDPPRP